MCWQAAINIQSINYISCPRDPSGGSTDNIFNNVGSILVEYIRCEACARHVQTCPFDTFGMYKRVLLTRLSLMS